MRYAYTVLIVLLLSTFCYSQNALKNCDKPSASKLLRMFDAMGDTSIMNNKVEFRWGSDWDYAPQENKIGLITAYADADACIAGEAREIIFTRRGKKVGEAHPSIGIQLVD